MSKVIVVNKPYGVLSQFRAEAGKLTMADFISDASMRIAGRLDADSEGLLLLTDDGRINARITQPVAKQFKTYYVQVDGAIDDSAVQALRQGVQLKDGLTLPAQVQLITEPSWLWPRTPPVRYRAAIPTSWVSISICEGKNRQVRRMTAEVGFPTLRLIRVALAGLTIEQLSIATGEVCVLSPAQVQALKKQLRIA